MKKNLLFSLYVISLFTMSCSKNNRTQGENEIFVDFKSDKPMVVKGPEDLFNYSDYIDSIAYVPLETTDDCLMGDVGDILFVNNKIFLRDSNTIFIFSGILLYITTTLLAQDFFMRIYVQFFSLSLKTPCLPSSHVTLTLGQLRSTQRAASSHGKSLQPRKHPLV